MSRAAPEQQNVVLMDAATLRETERLIESCEHCNPVGAEIPFDNILYHVTGSDPSVTDYILESPAKCPHCRSGNLDEFTPFHRPTSNLANELDL